MDEENQNQDNAAGELNITTESPLKMEQQKTEDNGQIEDHTEVVEDIKSPSEEMQTRQLNIDEQKEIIADKNLDDTIHEYDGKGDESKPMKDVEEHVKFETLMKKEEMVVKPKQKLVAKLEDLTDVESPDIGVYQYAIQFIEDLSTIEMSDGKLLVSQMHGLLFEGSYHLQIPFQNVRWIRKQTVSLQSINLSCIVLSYELEQKEISYIFFKSEEITDLNLNRVQDLKISESSTSLSQDMENHLRVQRLLSSQPLDISLASMSVVPKDEYYSKEKFPKKSMLMVMDLECMTFFDGPTSTPAYQLIFWTEGGRNVVEAVKLVHTDNEIYLETDVYLFVVVNIFIYYKSVLL